MLQSQRYLSACVYEISLQHDNAPQSAVLRSYKHEDEPQEDKQLCEHNQS